MGVKDTLHVIVGGDRHIKAVSVETLIICLAVSVDTQYKGVVGRDTDSVFGSVGRDARCKDGVGRDR